jgi:hypothetical protein
MGSGRSEEIVGRAIAESRLRSQAEKQLLINGSLDPRSKARTTRLLQFESKN